ncbi:unnamed protein product (macronuclear) [Paramecium tetraurelia]|uniref:Leucine Rich Repeat family protein n=1 Tax=Paramecium tetraurelia TaxID=5888 RepID=A0EIC5_PARTE|nr:uncharacterized protein GSPATT00027395001 [Paramecium tetraurelia]CAK95066.1 unnamed protein product [Paramecium tetraurelia]|eukprot:XP_001462439.1 hypothetical protein (macronuclear) [Paramecium tetraurelia strain d4-2]
MNKSLGPNLKYLQKIEEQEKMIEFLKIKYKETTGFEAPHMQTQNEVVTQSKVNPHSITLPQAKSIIFTQQNEEEKQSEQFQTFYDAVSNLKLPTKLLPSKTRPKNNLKTNIDFKNHYHLIEVIDLSNFGSKKFNRLAFKEFLEQVQDMRTLHTLKLRNNGIDDSYSDELKFIVSNTHVKSLDLSHNELGPKGMELFLGSIKEVTYFKSFDFSRNNFSHSLITLNQLYSALIQQTDLYHVCLDAFKPGQQDYKGADVLIKLVINQKSLRSVIIQDSIIQDLQKLSQSLSSLQCHLTELTLKYCFLTSEHISVLAQGLANNQSLIYLNLQHNGLNDLSGKYLAQMIQTNYYLYSIDLEHNQLGNDFIQLISVALKRNNVLNSLKLGYNSISEIKPLLNVIGPENTTLTDLGNIQQNPLLLAQVEQLQKRFKGSKDSTSNYVILKPINFTQILHRKQENYRVWNI